jgi:GntR family transcriptional repressor for pyruvate dehydrogenase complex
VRQVGRGTYVTEGVNRGSATPGIRPADPDGETSWGLADLTEARMLLEPELMSLVVERATAEDLDRIEQMLEDIALAETWSDFKERKYAFHLEMVKATKNEFLIDVFGSIVVARRQAWRQHAADKHPNVKVGKGLVLREGRMILKALRGRNAERAKAAVRLSLMRVLVSISEF